MPTRVGIYLRDTTGSSYGVPHIGNKPRVSATPYLYDIVKGNVAGHVALHKFGRNQAVGAADEIIWTPGGTGHYPYNATACPLNIVSTDLDDTGSGIGARTVSIEGLDAAGSSYAETITMNGDIPVLTTGSYLRVFRAKVLTAGASVENEGLINIRDIAGGSIMAQIDTGQNQAEMAMWTVPAGSTFYMVHLWASESATKTTRIILMAREPDGVFQNKMTFVLVADHIEFSYRVPRPFTSLTDLEIRGISSATGATVAAGFDGWYET